jgi:outer membrane protein OmpA-like peptidoglycan-associated protein
MHHRSNTTIAAMLLAATTATTTVYAAPPADPASGEKGEFQLQDTHTAKAAHGATASKVVPTRTEAAMKLFVVDKDKGPVKGVVMFLTGPDKKKYYAEPTDKDGYTELLVPVGQTYDITFLSLGRREIAATVPVADEPSQSVKLTLRYKREVAPRPLILDGVNFDTAKATIRPESFSHLDAVVDFMVHKKDARVEISGHTDNVGNAKANKTLSEKRAQACRNYIVSKGIDKKRLDAVGFGDEHPIAPNDSDEGRQKNRRIEAKEL